MRMPREPKLRSSCDGCGAAKLRCDRAQPACGRCLSLDLACVYGISRKTGKPPRERIRFPQGPAPSRSTGDQAYTGGHDRDGRDDNGSSNGGGFDYEGSIRASGQVISVNNVLAARDTVDSNPTSLRVDVHSLEPTHNDLFVPLVPEFTSMAFGDGLFSSVETTGPIPSLATHDSDSYSSTATQTNVPQTRVDENGYLSSALMAPVSGKSHDCFREAYDILGSLSLHNSDSNHSISGSSRPGSASTTASTADQIPLDLVLRLNREARERLSHLLACSCAGVPQLTILYASILSQILNWYHQAAGGAQSASWSPPTLKFDTSSYHVPQPASSPNSEPGSVSGSSTWSSAESGMFSAGSVKGARPYRQFTELAVAPAKMAIGTFNVDDQRVQTALNIQLLYGETKKVGRLIDQFTSHFAGQCLSEEGTFSGFDSLHQSLDSWLRSEHSRIAEMMRSKLRELNG